MDRISVIVPCYNEQEAIPIFYNEILKDRGTAYVRRRRFRFSSSDGSKDASLAEMKKLAEQDSRVKYVSFSRNFGKEAAMYAGLSYADGVMWLLWMWIFRTRLPCCPRCTGSLQKSPMTVWRRGGLPRKGEPPIRSFFARRFYAMMHPAFQDGYRGWSQRLPPDDPAVCERASASGRVQPVLQGAFRVGRL